MRILIVEDDESVAGMLVRFLTPICCSVPMVAGSMAQAFTIINDVSPLDLITLDLALPDSMPSQTLAKIEEIKKAKPDALLVVITGAVKPEQEADAMEAGADGFMHKAATCRSPDTFLGTLRDVARSIARLPTRYKKNIGLAEKLAQKICEHVACNFTDNPPQNS